MYITSVNPGCQLAFLGRNFYGQDSATLITPFHHIKKICSRQIGKAAFAMSQALPGTHTLTHGLLAVRMTIAATCFLLYGIVCSCIFVLGSRSAQIWGVKQSRMPLQADTQRMQKTFTEQCEAKH